MTQDRTLEVDAVQSASPEIASVPVTGPGSKIDIEYDAQGHLTYFSYTVSSSLEDAAQVSVSDTGSEHSDDEVSESVASSGLKLVNFDDVQVLSDAEDSFDVLSKSSDCFA